MGTVEGGGRREFLIAKGWIQAVLLVVLCGFLCLSSSAAIASSEESGLALK